LTIVKKSLNISAEILLCYNAGGASGIGLETTRVLALRKAHVIIAARNMESAEKAKQQITHENKSARVDIMKLDLCSTKSVRSFVDNFIALDLPLNILMFVHILILLFNLF
jgi:NAD(P)-dependent dehydrogenase (short-subunit alcohol dehydrogenase family)